MYPKEEKHHIGNVLGVDCIVEAGYGVQLRAVESLGRSGYTPLTTTHTNAFFLLPFTTRYPCQCNFNIKRRSKQCEHDEDDLDESLTLLAH